MKVVLQAVARAKNASVVASGLHSKMKRLSADMKKLSEVSDFKALKKLLNKAEKVQKSREDVR